MNKNHKLLTEMILQIFKLYIYKIFILISLI